MSHWHQIVLPHEYRTLLEDLCLDLESLPIGSHARVCKPAGLQNVRIDLAVDVKTNPNMFITLHRSW